MSPNMEWFNESWEALRSKTVPQAIKELLDHPTVKEMIYSTESFKKDASLDEKDLSAVSSVVTAYVLYNARVKDSFLDIAQSCLTNDEMRAAFDNEFSSLKNYCFNKVKEVISSRAEMWGKIDAIKREYGYTE